MTSKRNYLCMDAHKHSIESLYSKPLKQGHTFVWGTLNSQSYLLNINQLLIRMCCFFLFVSEDIHIRNVPLYVVQWDKLQLGTKPEALLWPPSYNHHYWVLKFSLKSTCHDDSGLVFHAHSTCQARDSVSSDNLNSTSFFWLILLHFQLVV